MDWDWAKFEGSAAALKYARRDLTTVDMVLEVTKGRVAVVQAGANLGIFPKYLSRHFETVYTFEPDPDLFGVMSRNAPEHNIVRFQAALGCDRGLLSTRRVRRDGSSKIAHEGITHVVPHGTVPTLRVDDLGLRTLDLLYLDLEGYEYFALLGASQTVHRCRPILVLEVNGHCRHYGRTPDDVRELAEDFGYRRAFAVHGDEIYVPN